MIEKDIIKTTTEPLDKDNSTVSEGEMFGADFILDYIEEQGIYLREWLLKPKSMRKFSFVN